MGLEQRVALNSPIAGGDLARPTFDELYDECFDFVWRNLRRLGVLEANLADAAQEVFIVVHRRLPDFEARAAVRSWVYSIVVRVARQHRRSARRKPTSPLDAREELADARAPGPERDAEQNQELRLLVSLLGGLAEPKREAFVLSELEGLTAPEIARILNVNLNTVYARIRAARRELELAIARRRGQAEGF